ncbi:MAG: tyrosine-type recombinase/integrase [Pseudonocardiaceae bacterium]
MSRDAVATRLTQHAATAGAACPTLTSKKITPHVLRHTAAMRLLAAGIDSTVIALWLGHESIDTTQIYLHADLKIKERAMDRTTPTGTQPGRYRPAADKLIAFLQAL